MRNSVLGKIFVLLLALPDDFLGSVHDLLEKLGGKSGVEWREATKRLLRKENAWGDVQKTLGQFFTTRPGLYVWDNFTNLVLRGLESVPLKTTEVASSYHDLKALATDSEIEKSLADINVPFLFRDIKSFLCHLAGLIEAQWEGKSGALLNSGYVNIFYVQVGNAVVTVYVRWRAGGRKWGVSAYSRGGFQWRAGDRVFRSN